MTSAMTDGKPPRPRKASARKPRPAAPERPRGGDARAIADLVPEVGRAAFRRFGFVQSAVVTRWAEIVGPRFAEVSAPESIRFPIGKRAGGTLELAVASGHAPLLQHVVPEIIERVNRFFGYGAVSKVRLRQGVIIAPRTAGSAGIARAAGAPAPTGLRPVADPELAAVLGSLAQSLASSAGAPQIAKDGPDDDFARALERFERT